MLCILNGVNHHKNEFAHAVEGMEVVLFHNKENQYSEYCVGVAIDGIGQIGNLAEKYLPAGFRNVGGIVKTSKDIVKTVFDENKQFKATLGKIKSNGAFVNIEIIEEPVIEEKEENTMDKWEKGVNNEEFTLVGCGRFDSDVKIGDTVVVDVENYYIRSNGKIGGTASAFTADGKKIGVFPQSDRKKADVEEMGGKVVSGDEIKEARASDTLINEGYFVVDISKDGRYIKVAFGGFEILPEEINEEEEVVNHIGQFTVLYEMVYQELMMKATIELAKTFTEEVEELEAMKEETTVEEPVSEETKEPNMEVEEMTELEKIEARMQEVEEVIAKAEVAKAAFEAKASELADYIEKGKEELDFIKRSYELTKEIEAERAEYQALKADIDEYIGKCDMGTIREVHKLIMSDGGPDEEEATSEEVVSSETTTEVVSNEEKEEYDISPQMERLDAKVEKRTFAIRGDDLRKRIKEASITDAYLNDELPYGAEIHRMEENDEEIKLYYYDHFCDAYGGWRKVHTIIKEEEECHMAIIAQSECTQCGCCYDDPRDA